nr:hypothetical protein [uncultured Cohaesibacter sp.]
MKNDRCVTGFSRNIVIFVNAIVAVHNGKASAQRISSLDGKAASAV